MKKTVGIFLVIGAIMAVTGCSQSSGSSSGGGDDSSDSKPSFTTYTTSNGLKSNSIKTIVVNNTGIYAGTDGGLSVSTDNGKTWKTYTVTDGLVSNSVGSLYVLGDYILAGTDKGLSETGDNGKTWKTKTTMEIGGFALDGDKTYFTSGGYIWSTSDFSNFHKTRASVCDIPTSIILVSGKVYVSHFGDSVTVSSDGCYSWSTCSSGLGSQFVNSVTASGSTLYAATIAGLSVSTDFGASWTTYTTANGLVSDDMGCVAASDGMIYVGIVKSGLSVSSDGGKSWKQYTKLDGLPSDAVNCITVSGKKVYIGTDSGLAIMQ